MIYEYLQRGVIAGVIAGIAYGVFMATVGNPLSEYIHDHGHDHGHGHDHTHSHAHDHAHAVSETVTAIVSVGSGMLWAIFLGGIFAIALYVFEPALPGREAGSAYLIAAAGFFSVSVTPWLALPPAAPGAENAYGIDTRLAMYVALIGLGVVVSAVSIVAYKRTTSRNRVLGLVSGSVPIIATVIVVPLATPTIVTHPELSGTLVSAFQATVFLSQAAIWVLIAAVFNWLRRRESVDRSLSRERVVTNH